MVINNKFEKYQNKYRIKSARAPWWDYNGNGTYFITICCKNRIPYFGKIQNGRMQLNKHGQVANDCWANIPNHFPFAELGWFVIMPDHVHGIISVNMDGYNRNNKMGYGNKTLDNNKNGDDNITGGNKITAQYHDTHNETTRGLINARNLDNSRGIVETAHARSLQSDITIKSDISKPGTDIKSDIENVSKITKQQLSSQTIQYNDAKISRRDLLLEIQPSPHSLPTIIRSYKSAVSKSIHEFDKTFKWQSRYYDHIIRNNDEYQRITEYIVKNPMTWELIYKDFNYA
jgi:REP element-mobilizing transposase RayT